MYDLAVIGGGPAGYSAALEASKLGLKVILFEKNHLGGTCLNKGCIPTKFLSNIAELCYQMEECEKSGIIYSNVKVDYFKILGKKIELITSLRSGLEHQLRQGKIQIVNGFANIKDKHCVVCNNKEFEVENILIATGSLSKKPVISGALTSDELLNIQTIPSKLYIIGGGIVAVEFAYIFQALGTQVSMFVRGERILRKWDKEVALKLMQNMKKKGIIIQTKCNFENVFVDENAVVLSAIGREPNVNEVNRSFFDMGIDGGIIVDEVGRTKTDNIYAAGDVISNSSQLAHVAMKQGIRVAQSIAGRVLDRMSTIAKCIYVGQEVVNIGLTEKEARELGIEVVIAKQTMSSNARTVITTCENGFIKLVADRKNNKLIGAQLMCERAGDIAAELTLVINMSISPRDMLNSIRTHPSYCEAITDALNIMVEKL